MPTFHLPIIFTPLNYDFQTTPASSAQKFHGQTSILTYVLGVKGLTSSK